MRIWCHVSHSDPCRICGKPTWCVLSADGAWAICRRFDTGTGLHKVDKAGANYWLYHLHGRAVPRPLITAPPAQSHTERAEPSTLDQVYRALLALLPLSGAHRRPLRQRGLSDRDIVQRGYRTLAADGRTIRARQLLEHFGPDVCITIPGLYVHTQGARRWWGLAGAPGLVIPVRDRQGQVVGLKVRADHPGEGPKYTYLSSTKHGGPGPGAPVHVPLHDGLLAQTIRLTEGELKADVATALSGLWTLSVAGVSAWRPTLPLVHQLEVTTVYLAFDADWRTNVHVARAFAGLAAALTSAGVEVRVEVWEPAHGKGIDDVLGAGHAPTVASVALAFGAGFRSHTTPWTAQRVTQAAEEVPAWH